MKKIETNLSKYFPKYLLKYFPENLSTFIQKIPENMGPNSLKYFPKNLSEYFQKKILKIFSKKKLLKCFQKSSQKPF